MTFVNYRVQQVSKDAVALLITSDTANCHDKWVAWVVDTWNQKQWNHNVMESEGANDNNVACNSIPGDIARRHTV